MQTVLVITEIDIQDKEQIVIGVSSNHDNAMRMIQEYYGVYEILKEYIHDGIGHNLMPTLILKVWDHLNKPYKVKIIKEVFVLDSI